MRLLAAALAALAICAGTSGCSAPSEASGRPTVVASFYPLQYAAQRIVGGHAAVENLTHPGTEPHDLELGVRDTADIVDAAVMFYEKGFQPAVDQAVAQNGPDHVVDVSTVIPGLESDNPHFWLDPVMMREAAAALREEMVQVDPAHAADYRANYAAFAQDLTALDRAYTEGLADCALHTTVVSHDAFGYLSRYGLDFVSINGLSPEAEPSPAHIRQLHELVRATGVTTIFSEELASPEMADTLAADLGLTTAVLDPIEGLSDETQDEDYLSLMRANLTALETANQCR